MIKSSIVAIALLAGMLSVANADLTVTHSAGLPSLPLIISQDTNNGDSYNWLFTDTTRRDLGQSFKAPSDTILNSLTLGVKSVGASAPGSYFAIHIYEAGLVTTAPNSTESTLVYEKSGFLPENMGAGYLNLDLGEIVELKQGVYYSFVLSFDPSTAADSGRYVGFQVRGNGSFDGGIWTSSDGENFSSLAGNDLVFYAFSPIPEPGAVTLVGVGLLGAAGGFLKKKK